MAYVLLIKYHCYAHIISEKIYRINKFNNIEYFNGYFI